ncbi:hypothetical protein [Sulfurovum sp.]|uniref:hypothetical protein n=1 Tax=Sulfurovum sp. TaxID=1969726 RepID=UPI00356449D3
MAVLTTIPSARVPFIDPRTGLISREWFNFFNNLFSATGGGEGSLGGWVLKTTNYSPSNDDLHVVCDGTFTVTLQDPATRNSELIVTNVGSGIISLAGNVNGSLTRQIGQKYTSVRLRPVTTSYLIV